MREVIARAKVLQDEKGRYSLEIPNMDWFRGELSGFGPGTAVVVSVKKWYKKRSLGQNNLFHWYADILADYFGYPLDTMKLLIRLKWLKVPLLKHDGSEAVDITTGEVLFDLRSTSDLNTVEMAELCDEIRTWAMDGWGVVLPLPDQNTEINFK